LEQFARDEIVQFSSDIVIKCIQDDGLIFRAKLILHRLDATTLLCTIERLYL